MKKPYQIESQRAVKQLETMAAAGNPAVQMVLPMAEMVGWLRKGVGALIRQAGLQLMDLIMQEEVREPATRICPACAVTLSRSPAFLMRRASFARSYMFTEDEGRNVVIGPGTRLWDFS